MLAGQPTRSSQTKNFLRWLEASSDFFPQRIEKKKNRSINKEMFKSQKHRPIVKPMSPA